MPFAGRSLIVILGPTAIGKTSLALDVAEAVNGEIVGADSRQVYRYMDIGTAKPTAEQSRRVRHHLIDIVEPDEPLGLAQYQRKTYSAIDAIQRRGNLPLLVGGTGQYISAVIEGWSIPEVAPNLVLRAELEQFAARNGSQALHERLRVHDAVAADRIHPNNVRRVVRALEVCLESGLPFSELQRKKPPPYQIMQVGLTMDRDQLYQKADRRVDQMLDAGFLEEVQGLLERGYDRSLPSMSGLGYAQFTAHLLDGIPLDEAIATTKTATHDFIRRQFTWFRGHDPGVLWHNMVNVQSSQVINVIGRWLEEQG